MNTISVDFKKHSFHSDNAAAEWTAKKNAYVTALNSNTVIDEANAKIMVDHLIDGNESEKAGVIDQLCLAAKAMDDTHLGRLNSIVQRSKTVTQSVLPVLGQTIVSYTSFGDESELDMAWRMIFAVDPLQGTFKGSLFDIKSLVEAHDLATETSDIPQSDFMASTWTNILPEYKGSSVRVAKGILRNDPMTTINSIIVAIRYALEEKKSRLAYAQIQAAITAANSAGYTTAFATSVVQTINAARLALGQRNFDKGWAINGTTPMILMANEAHRGVIEAAFNLLPNTMTNTQAGTQVIQYPITRVYTYNLDADLGISGSKVALILPTRKNRYGIFNNPLIQSFEKGENSAVLVQGREAYNFISNTPQFQVVTIA